MITKGKKFFVSPNGSDTATGTEASPFRTLTRAADAVRSFRAKHPDKSCTVVLRGGVYAVRDTLTLTGADSGCPSAPVIWCAADGEKPVISGGTYVAAEAFRAADDAFVSALREEPQAPILMLDLKEQGIVAYEDIMPNGLRPAELYVGNTRYGLPRYPKDAMLKFEKNESETSFYETDPVVLGWRSFDGIRAFGYMEADYFSKDLAARRDGKIVRLTSRIDAGRPYRYYNIPYELTAKGTYYVDREAGRLYVCPADGFASEPIVFSQSSALLLKADGLHDVVFDGIAFEGVRGDAVRVMGDRITFRSCLFSKIGKNVMHISGMENRILHCEACAVGGAGFIINGGDCEKMIDACTLVDSNHIHHYALNGSTYQAAISAEGGLGHTFSHNLIHDSIHNGINGYCPDLTVEYNIIHNVCSEAHDAGAIYTGRWHSRNTVYRYNLIYDNVNIYGLGVPFGIYNDDSGSGKKIYGNILCNVAGYGVKQGAGNNNEIFNNLIIDTLVSIDDDERSYYGNFQTDMCRFPDGFFFHEQVWFPSYGTRSWIARHASSTLLRYTDAEDRTSRWVSVAPGMTVVRGNVCVHSGPVQLVGATATFAVSRDNVHYESAEAAGIADVKNHDFRLNPSSPIYRDVPHWQDIPVSEIGPRPIC